MNVLIVDDHPIVVEYLRAAAGRAMPGATVRVARNLEAALASMLEAPAELVLLDLGLPGCGGIDSLLKFRAAYPEARIVVISSEDGHGLIRGALATGAVGYIPKTSGPQVMLNALRLVAEGGRYIPPEALEDGVSVRPVEISAPAEPDQAQGSVLTVRQREVLDRLLEGRTIGQVAEDLGIAEATAKHHALAVYAAYGVSSRADLIIAATRRMSAGG
jgi:two-component system, NarL family, nitrate/nitrite response regulator NarL